MIEESKSITPSILSSEFKPNKSGLLEMIEAIIILRGENAINF
jgi:hypothetical protein